MASISGRLSEFGLRVPTGLALLPSNIGDVASLDQLRQHAEADTVRTLLRGAGIHLEEPFSEENWPEYIQQYGSEWFGPTIFVAAGLLSQNPNILSVALGVITNYLYDLFKGEKDAVASLEVVTEAADGSSKSVKYKGPVDGIKGIVAIIESLSK